MTSGVPTLHVYMTHFQFETESKKYKKRNEYLATSIFYLSQISEYRIKIWLISNSQISNFEELSLPILSRVDNSSINLYVADPEEITDNGVKFDWLLTWVHKKIMIKDFHDGLISSDDMLVVLEDDALFTEANIKYFREEKLNLETLGLIPSYLRSEWSLNDMCWVNVDPIGRLISTRTIHAYPNHSDKIFIQLINPFSASIVLDKELAVEYFNSESFDQKLACNKHPIIYDIGSSATLGLIAEKVPKGFINRVGVVCNKFNCFPIPGSIIRHLGDRYALDKWHKNVRLYDREISPELPLHRTALDFLIRIFQPDGLVVIKNYLAKKSRSR